MPTSDVYPRRRLALGLAAIVLMWAADHQPRRPMIGSLSITMDDATHLPQVSAEWAPHLALAGALLARGAAFVGRQLTR